MTPKPLRPPQPPRAWSAREQDARKHPRTDAARSPGAHLQVPNLEPPRRWSAEELSILQREYPLRGEACRSMLPGRGLLAINLQAHRMGLRPPTPASKPTRGRA